MKPSLIERDLKHIWHPCSQMKDYETFKPLEVVKAIGSHIEIKDGRKLIDAISSWWCKSLGHDHPRLKDALLRQMNQFAHVILANTTSETIVTLSEKLANLTHSLSKVFYASDGSCAVEIAMKMSLHARKIQGDGRRNQLLALENSYHGDTLGALSVSDLGIYRDPYQKWLLDVNFLSPLPYVSHIRDTVWHDCKPHWEMLEKQLDRYQETATAIIIEPIVQGAGGMKIYSQDFLKRLRAWTKKHNVHLIADEIMTGIGRTGKMLACEHAQIEPDFLCLSKGLTSGWLPLSAVLTTNAIYELFYDDYEKGNSFLHSHTHAGNHLAASVAIETLNLIEEEKLCDRADQMSGILYRHLQDIADKTGKLTNVRSIGAIAAADLVSDHPNRRLGFEVYQKAVALGALLRPLGNTIYWLPPLTTDDETLAELKRITEESIFAISSRE